MTKAKTAAQAWLVKLKQKSSFLSVYTRYITLTLVVVLIVLTLPIGVITNGTNLPKISARRLNPPDLQIAPPIPVKKQTTTPLDINAKGAIAIDSNSSSILFELNPDQTLLPASTTKIMTALVALDKYSLSDTIIIDREEHTIGHTMNLVKGEQITVENLLYGMLVSSGNDAALALALSYPHGGYSGFIAEMNQKAADLQLTKTTYKNVSGVESRGHVTTPRDLAHLAKFALKNPVFKKMVATQKIKLESTDGRFIHDLETTNYLLGRVNGVSGVKTGWTENALECLVTSVERDGHEVIIVILGSVDRFGNTQKLIDWIYQNYDWENPQI